jgi:hypothetical protein
MNIDGENDGGKEGLKKVKAAELIMNDQVNLDKEAGPVDRSCRTQ